MPRRGGRDRYRTRTQAVRNKDGYTTPISRANELLTRVADLSVVCTHGMPWKDCTLCSRRTL